jgi:hypothetical protein
MRSLCCLCVCMHMPPMNFWMPETVFMKLYMYAMTPEPISKAASRIPPTSLCVCMCIPLWLISDGSVYTFPRQRIQATIENCWTRRYLCDPWRIKESRRIVCMCVCVWSYGRILLVRFNWTLKVLDEDVLIHWLFKHNVSFFSNLKIWR